MKITTKWLERNAACGEVKTGTVGVTSGWKPVFLLMARRNCIGSSTVLTHNVEFTTEKVSHYQEVA